MAQEHRLRQQIEALEQKYELLGKKLSQLEQEKIYAVDPNVRFNLEHSIEETTAEREEVEKQLTDLEAQLEAEEQKIQERYHELTTPTEEQQAALQRGIERLQQETRQAEQIRQQTQRKSVGTKPYLEKLLVDRVAYLETLAEHIQRDDSRLILVVGQGGIGKTQLVAKFCNEIEKARYTLTPMLLT